MNYYKETDIRSICKDFKCSFRKRQDKIYLTVTGKFTHAESIRLREQIEKVLGNKIYMTSGGFGFGMASKMVLRLNPDAKLLEALNY
jgi:hypothetical protein